MTDILRPSPLLRPLCSGLVDDEAWFCPGHSKVHGDHHGLCLVIDVADLVNHKLEVIIPGQRPVLQLVICKQFLSLPASSPRPELLTGERVFLLVIILRQAPDRGGVLLAPVCVKVQPQECCLVQVVQVVQSCIVLA